MGLRESKKAATRLQISNVATHLFIERGFDSVSVADVAKAANVSKMTIFNYFPRKEDLFFDREKEVQDTVRAALASRKKGTSIVGMLGALAQRFVDEPHPFAKWNDDTERFIGTVTASPTLLARARELREEAERDVAVLLAEAAGQTDDPRASVIAVGTVSAWRVAYGRASDARAAGKRPAVIRKIFLDTFEAGFGMVRRAAKGTPYG